LVGLAVVGTFELDPTLSKPSGGGGTLARGICSVVELHPATAPRQSKEKLTASKRADRRTTVMGLLAVHREVMRSWVWRGDAGRRAGGRPRRDWWKEGRVISG
jgi:hypothetical protein